MPLPTNIQAEDIVKIINEAELRCLICSFAEVGSLGPLLCNCTTVKSLIVMDLPTHIDPTAESVLQKVQINQHSVKLSQTLFFSRVNNCLFLRCHHACCGARVIIVTEGGVLFAVALLNAAGG